MRGARLAGITAAAVGFAAVAACGGSTFTTNDGGSGAEPDVVSQDAPMGGDDAAPEAQPHEGGGDDASGIRDATTDVARDVSSPDAPLDVGSFDSASEGGKDASADASDASTGTGDASDGGIVCNPIVATGSKAVAYQIDTAHSGSQPNDQLSLPFCERWRRDLGGALSYPLVAGGRVFVTVATGNGGGSLVALDEATGNTLWGPAPLGGSTSFTAAAWDADVVYALNSNGALYALQDSSGKLLWQTSLQGQSSFSSAPTATGGFVYTGGAGSGGTLYAVVEATGATRWTQPVANGDNSSPAVSTSTASGGVFVSYACNQAYGFSATSGTSLWHYNGPCEGGGGNTVALLGGNVYTRDSIDGNRVISGATGASLGTYGATRIPAGAGTTIYVVNGNALSATPAGQITPTWTFTLPPADGVIASDPLVVGSTAIVASATGSLYAVDIATGKQASSANVGAWQRTNGFAAADGRLFVAVDSRLVSY